MDLFSCPLKLMLNGWIKISLDIHINEDFLKGFILFFEMIIKLLMFVNKIHCFSCGNFLQSFSSSFLVCFIFIFFLLFVTFFLFFIGFFFFFVFRFTCLIIIFCIVFLNFFFI